MAPKQHTHTHNTHTHNTHNTHNTHSTHNTHTHNTHNTHNTRNTSQIWLLWGFTLREDTIPNGAFGVVGVANLAPMGFHPKGGTY